MINAIFRPIVSGVGGLFDRPDPNSPAPTPEETARDDARSTAAKEFFFAYLETNGLWLPAWSFDDRGDHRLVTPETRDAWLAMSRPTRSGLERDLAMRVRCCDILELQFDDTLVSDFIALVKVFARVSERVEIVLFPINAEWIERTPEGLERQRQVLERIRRETGVAIADFQNRPPLAASNFVDVTHLNAATGGLEISRVLADHYAPALSGGR